MTDVALFVSDSADMATAAQKKKGCPCGCVSIFFGAATLLFLFGIALGPIGPGNQRQAESAAMQQARTIGLLLFSYANDHDQQYPDGKSSTEVFQQLIDGQYCADPSVFYIPRAGKIKALVGQKLKPENVCFDVTGGLDSSSGVELPVVFTTGYKVDYVPDGSATPLRNSPQFDERTWSAWWNGEEKPWADSGIAVCYKSNSSKFIKRSFVVNPDGSVSQPPVYKPYTPINNFILPTFKPDGKTYRQLTPDGVLP